MTRTPSGSPAELEARVAVLERTVHTALAQLGATGNSGPGEAGDVRLAVEVLKRALRPDSARPAPPLACFWLQEPDGSRWLVPGCMDRMHDADIDACTCHHLDYRLAVAERHRAEAQRAHDGLRTWTDAVIASVHAHPDGTAIMRRAAEACDTSHRAGAEKARHHRPKAPSAPRSVH
ncbi:hypothetical protein CLM85_14545 [Streptomyces albidoflavus]|uniref:hypothetical protein n=1 Tax=Streptomyces albidoflavus TaxID=1886 RepID=UPI000BAE366C|nr:hypothetical protein [Streptomyces albidoflavus]PAX86048.1 hypothetical protein CLM81_10720 [Streptomyces albidoflavus]PAX92643.1 hypothetical protein CLM82_02160 [Streptomyces albidoflavus]PBO19217.1 hypothetical protein CLM83_07775 [Streptomyces albidoflavus]PBO23706.1 hypothetical protein CLM85_14545 [Streptomyces albidoflavus]PBO30789.1 hypothetical protein CLM84_06415 [Streptomyces albidoflavus]